MRTLGPAFHQSLDLWPRPSCCRRLHNRQSGRQPFHTCCDRVQYCSKRLDLETSILGRSPPITIPSREYLFAPPTVGKRTPYPHPTSLLASSHSTTLLFSISANSITSICCCGFVVQQVAQESTTIRSNGVFAL